MKSAVLLALLCLMQLAAAVDVARSALRGQQRALTAADVGGSDDAAALAAALPLASLVNIGVSLNGSEAIAAGVLNGSFVARDERETKFFAASAAELKWKLAFTRDKCDAVLSDVKEESIGASVTVQYNCIAAGDCALSATLRAQPKDVVLEWTRSCGGGTASSVQMGTARGLADVAKSGLVLPPWGGAGGSPQAIAAEETTSSLWVAGEAEAEKTFRYRRPHVTANADVISVAWSGDVDDDRVDVPLYERHGVWNIARGKATNMSSVWQGHGGWIAVDGAHEGDTHASCAITGAEGYDEEPFFEIDLGTSGLASLLAAVRVWGRADTDEEFGQRLVPFWLLISDTPLPRQLAAARQAAKLKARFDSVARPYFYPLDEPVGGRYVRVQMEEADYLMLSEVEVLAVPPSHVCEQPLPATDELYDPICYPATQDAPQQLQLAYTCKAAGETTVEVALPFYPPYEPVEPMVVRLKKTCAAEMHGALAIGLAQFASDVMANGQLAAVWDGSKHGEQPPTAPAPATRAHQPGAEHVTRFWLTMTAAGETQAIAPPRLTVWPNATAEEGSSRRAAGAPVVAGSLAKGGTVGSNGTSFIDVAYRCTQPGFLALQMEVTPLPAFQPYAPFTISWTHDCGGVSSGLHLIHAPDERSSSAIESTSDDNSDGDSDSDSDSDGSEGGTVENEGVDGEATATDADAAAAMRPVVLVRDGIALPAASNFSVGAEEKLSMFNLTVPFVEPALPQAAHALATLCDDPDEPEEAEDGQPPCTPLRITASCEPASACAATALGTGSGPALSIERDEEAGTHRLWLSYHCTRDVAVKVKLRFEQSWYNSTEVSFTKHCPSRGILFYVLLAVGCAAVVGVIAFAVVKLRG